LGVLVLFVIGYAGTLVWANDAEKTDALQSTATLLERLEKLESRVSELEKSLTAQADDKHKLVTQYAEAVVHFKKGLSTPMAPAPKPIPKEWLRREINGLEYFIVPLKKH